MIDGESAFTHHLFEVAVGELIPAIPTDTQKDDSGLEVAPLERGLFHFQECDSGSVLNEPAGALQLRSNSCNRTNRRQCCEKYIRTQKVTSDSFSGGDLKERGNEPRLPQRIATG